MTGTRIPLLTFRAHLATLPGGEEILSARKYPTQTNRLHAVLSWADRERPDVRVYLRKAHADYRAMRRVKFSRNTSLLPPPSLPPAQVGTCSSGMAVDDQTHLRGGASGMTVDDQTNFLGGTSVLEKVSGVNDQLELLEGTK